MNDLGLARVGPGTFVLVRFAIAAAVALPVVLVLRRRAGKPLWVGGARVPPLWFWGLCAANALAFLLQYAGQVHTTPARTALFVNTSAFLVALLERVLFGMRLGRKRTVAVVLGFSGAAILIVGGDPSQLADGRLLGDALAMLAGLAWSVFFVYNDRFVAREDPAHLMAFTFAGSAILLLGAPLLDPWLARDAVTGLDAGAWPVLLYSGVVTTALAFGLWAYGLTGIRASVSAVLLLVEILVASLVSVALGRESFGPFELLGAGILVVAVLLVSSVARGDGVG